MLDQTKNSRPRTVAELEIDIRDFWRNRGSDSTETRNIRNTFWICQHTTAYLEQMYAHTLECAWCKKRIESLT